METNDTKEMIPNGAKYVLEIEGKKCYLKAITRPVMEQALGLIMPLTGSPKMITAGEMILNSCWISGDDEIKTDPELYVDACLNAVQLIERKASSLKKL
jgi:hypothetical protein